MILHTFPDIHWLRQQSRSNFDSGKDINGNVLPSKGWPSVVLNTTSRGDERNSITAPFSLFMNLHGTSEVKTDGRNVSLSKDTFALVNKGGIYDLTLPEKVETTTFNIHFGEKLYNETVHMLNLTHEQLLDAPEGENIDHKVFFRTHWKSPELIAHVHSLNDYYQNVEQADKDKETLLLHNLLVLLLRQNQKDKSGLEHLNSLKKSTKVELAGRLVVAIDFIHANYKNPIDIDQLSAVACLSKYHFLRTFKALFGCTPHQYLAKVRLSKAQELLKFSKQPISEIAMGIGFQEPNSFVKFFRKFNQQSPSQYRCSN